MCGGVLQESGGGFGTLEGVLGGAEGLKGAWECHRGAPVGGVEGLGGV